MDQLIKIEQLLGEGGETGEIEKKLSFKYFLIFNKSYCRRLFRNSSWKWSWEWKRQKAGTSRWKGYKSEGNFYQKRIQIETEMSLEEGHGETRIHILVNMRLLILEDLGLDVQICRFKPLCSKS